MHLKTILNRAQKYKSFVYGKIKWIDTGSVSELEVEIKARANSQAVCSICGCKASGYDPLPVAQTLSCDSSAIQVGLGITSYSKL